MNKPTILAIVLTLTLASQAYPYGKDTKPAPKPAAASAGSGDGGGGGKGGGKDGSGRGVAGGGGGASPTDKCTGLTNSVAQADCVWNGGSVDGWVEQTDKAVSAQAQEAPEAVEWNEDQKNPEFLTDTDLPQ